MDMLRRYGRTLSPGDHENLDLVGHYIEWQVGQAGDFIPSASDDVELRTYLLALKIRGVSRRSQRKQIAALRHFYDWAKTRGLVAENPFNHFNFDRPFLTREQIRRAAIREVSGLRARLHELAEQLAQFGKNGRRRRRRVRAIHSSRDPEGRAIYELGEQAELVVAELAGELDEIPF